MTFIEYSNKFSVIFLNNFKNIIDFFSFNIQYKTITPEFTFYINLSTGIINITLISLLILFIINFLFNIFFKNLSLLNNIFRYVNLIVITIIFILLLIKFYMSLRLEQAVGPYIYDVKYLFYVENNNINFIEYCSVFSSSFSDAILLLSFITGIICLELLGLKNLFKSMNNISLFLIFNFFVTIMVSTNNLLIMFISFEFIFLPTMYFVYKLGYSKKIDKANEILFYWTLFGSFLVLTSLGYLYYNFSSLNYLILSQKQFSKLETQVLLLVFLIGFGVKIPLAPFHYWLLKVHVESPTAFSIFLSGFLVKSALYCLFMLLNMFNTTQHYFILTSWIFYSLIIGTIGLAKSTDIKKLIAWATIQEMTFMLLFLVFKQMFLTHTCILFVILHGLMSTYMFYIVDMLQRRYKTRGLQYIKGLNIYLPRLTKHIWFLILLFSGFPLTAKFFIEWSLISLMVESQFVTLLYVIVFVNFFGAIFFCRIMFMIIYGIPEEKEELEFVETQKKEYGILNLLVLMILILIWLLYIF